VRRGGPLKLQRLYRIDQTRPIKAAKLRDVKDLLTYVSEESRTCAFYSVLRAGFDQEGSDDEEESE